MLSQASRLLLAGAICLGVQAAACAQPADPYPNHPVRVIVPYTAGGPVDIVARIVGQPLSESLKQPIVVENRGGAGGNIGSAIVAHAAPDGHTLLVNTAATVTTPLVGQKASFDPMKDLVPVVKIGRIPALLVVSPSQPYQSVQELIRAAKAKPGELTFASPGVGASIHLAGELFTKMAGVSMTHIPFKGTSEAMPQVMSGQVTMTFSPIAESLSLVQSGKLRALAISTPRRSSALPELSPVSESGVLGYDFSVWYALFAPAGTPQPVIDKLAEETLQVLARPEVRKALAARGMEVIAEGPAEFARSYQAEQKLWADLIRERGIKIAN